LFAGVFGAVSRETVRPIRGEPAADVKLANRVAVGIGRMEAERPPVVPGLDVLIPGVGQVNHRAYSTWNLVEGVIAAALLKHVRAGSVAHGMTRLRSMLEHQHIDPEEYCKAPGLFAFSGFELVFPPRSEPDDKAGPPMGEEMGEGGYLLATAQASNEPYYGPPARGTPLAAACRLSIDLAQAVRFVEHMIETKL
jgi:hypothetical protein